MGKLIIDKSKRVVVLTGDFYSKGSKKEVSRSIHTNAKFLKDASSSEGLELRKTLDMANRVNYMMGHKKEEFTPKAKREFLAMKKEANQNFKNETAWRGIV